MVINEWIRDHKKIAVFAGAGLVILLLFGLFLLVNSVVTKDASEEKEPTVIVTASNLEVLYDSFSDYTIGYVLAAIGNTLSKGESTKNGSLLSSGTQTPTDATNDSLYPDIESGEYYFTVVDGRVEDYEDTWGIWKTFTIQTEKNSRFKVNVSIGAHNRVNDLNYTQIEVLKL